MSRWRVCDVMTREVVSVRRDAPFREIVEVLRRGGISALPVVDVDGRVLGVVSEADLLAKVEYAGDAGKPRLFDGRRQRVARHKSAATVADELMSAPAVTTTATASVVEAARLLDASGVKRLPVVDDAGRLVGIVSRGDLLSVFLRPDAQIRAEVENEVLDKLRLDPADVLVEVAGGRVTLAGDLETRSLASLAVRLVEGVDGVVCVNNRLSYRRDDTVRSEFDQIMFFHRP